MKKNDASKAALLEQLRKTPVLQIACEKVGISRVTLYRWRAADAEFAKAIDGAMLEGRLMVNDLAESQLISAVKDRNFNAIAYWLRHNHSVYKNKVEIEGALKVIEEMSPEQAAMTERLLNFARNTIGNHERTD